MATVFGLDVGDLPEGWTPLRAVVVVECIDLADNSPDSPGAKRLSTRASDETDLWTGIGMLRAAGLDFERQYLDAVGPDDA